MKAVTIIISNGQKNVDTNTNQRDWLEFKFEEAVLLELSFKCGCDFFLCFFFAMAE